MKKNLLLLSKSDLHSDPRILKQIEALTDDYNITTVGYTKSLQNGLLNELPLFKRKKNLSLRNKLWIIVLLFLKRYERLHWTTQDQKAYSVLSQTKFHVIIANELNTLPLACKIAKLQEVNIYCDLHEYYFVNKSKNWYNILSKGYKYWIPEKYFKEVKKFSTINPGVSRLYKEEFGIDCKLIDNACSYYNLKPKPTDSQNIKLVTHGASIRSRKLELMIEVVALLDKRFTLDMYLMPSDPDYVDELKLLVQSKCPGKVNILGAIPFDKIQSVINNYDIGLYIIFPTHLNNRLSLPNKLFEFIQGRVAIAIGPSESMIPIIEEYDIGVVADNFEPQNLANKLNLLSAQNIEKFKKNTTKAAKERNSDINKSKIQEIINSLV